MAEATSATPATRRQHWWRVAQAAFLLAALAYTVRMLVRHWGAVKDAAADVHPNWPLLVGASGIVLFTYVILIQSWRVLIAGEGSYLRFPAAARIWFVANLGRYIPGKVWSIAALNVLAAREGVSGAAAAGAAILGTLLNIGAGFGVIALSGSRLVSGLPGFRTVSVVGSIVFVVGVAALPWILPPIAVRAARLLGRTPPPVRIPAVNLLTAVTINVVSWFCYGWAFMVFCAAVMPTVHGTVSQFTAVWAASYVLGYVALFSPGGFFIREGTLVAAMVALGMASTTDAAIVATVSRLWLSVVELLPGLVALAFSRTARRLPS